jgi:hypothetical protein
MIFVKKGDVPLTEGQLLKRTQAYVNNTFTDWQRERSIRKDNPAFETYMAEVESDTDVNRANNFFNIQLAAYKKAKQRLSQHTLASGREEIKELRPTGEQTLNETTMEMEDVMEEVVVVTAIEPLESTVEVAIYTDDMNAASTVETIENPLITQDKIERAESQAVVDATPQSVIDFTA